MVQSIEIWRIGVGRLAMEQGQAVLWVHHSIFVLNLLKVLRFYFIYFDLFIAFCCPNCLFISGHHHYSNWFEMKNLRFGSLSNFMSCFLFSFSFYCICSKFKWKIYDEYEQIKEGISYLQSILQFIASFYQHVVVQSRVWVSLSLHNLGLILIIIHLCLCIHVVSHMRFLCCYLLSFLLAISFQWALFEAD